MTLLDNAELRVTEFPLSADVAYFNHAANAPYPQRTVAALDAANRAFAAPHRAPAADAVDPISSARAAVARIAGSAPERVAFVASLAHGISICAAGMAIEPGDEVIIPHAEYPSLALPFLAQQPRGLAVRWARRDSEGRTDLEHMQSLVTERTKAIALSHVEFADGWQNNLEALGEFAQSSGLLLIVDATQSLAAMPMRLDDWGVHAAVAHGYKWLHAGYGIGVAIFSEEGLARIQPTHAGGQSITSAGFVDEQTLVFHENARRFETGGLPFTLISGMAASLTLIEEIGVDAIHAHALALIDQIAAGAAERGWTVVTSLKDGDRSSILAITSGDHDQNVAAQVALEEAGVITVLRPRGIRIAPTFYNNMDDVDRLLAALPTVSAAG